jgi:hypothetical protein
VFVSCQQSEGQKRSIKTSNKFFESVAKFIYFGTTIMSQNFIQGVIKKRQLKDSMLPFILELFASQFAT